MVLFSLRIRAYELSDGPIDLRADPGLEIARRILHGGCLSADGKRALTNPVRLQQEPELAQPTRGEFCQAQGIAIAQACENLLGVRSP